MFSQHHHAFAFFDVSIGSIGAIEKRISGADLSEVMDQSEFDEFEEVEIVLQLFGEGPTGYRQMPGVLGGILDALTAVDVGTTIYGFQRIKLE
jgi:hypothetical protein